MLFLNNKYLELVVSGRTLNHFCVDELISFEQVARIRELIGRDVPFIVSCYGVTYENLNEELVDRLA